MTKKIISWDLGATKCMVGLVNYNQLNSDFGCEKNFTVKIKEATSLEALVDKLEEGLNFSFSKADAICIGAAGHYDGECLIHANSYPYVMNFNRVAKMRQWDAYTVIHDYASVVCATFTNYMHHEKNIKRLNTRPIQLYGRRIALGVGTGLGLKDAILFANGDFWLGQNEIGHIGIPTPPTAQKQHLIKHKEIMRFLNAKFKRRREEPITFEKILTGNGIATLYEFFHPQSSHMTPELVGEKMKNNEANEIKETFAWYMGLLVGTVQLAFMPEGGIWITGGVIMNHLDIFDYPDFFEGIHASPAYLDQRRDYPLGILRDPEHAIMGSAYYATKRLL